MKAAKKECPSCRRRVPSDARACRACHYIFPDESSTRARVAGKRGPSRLLVIGGVYVLPPVLLVFALYSLAFNSDGERVSAPAIMRTFSGIARGPFDSAPPARGVLRTSNPEVTVRDGLCFAGGTVRNEASQPMNGYWLTMRILHRDGQAGPTTTAYVGDRIAPNSSATVAVPVPCQAGKARLPSVELSAHATGDPSALIHGSSAVRVGRARLKATAVITPDNREKALVIAVGGLPVACPSGASCRFWLGEDASSAEPVSQSSPGPIVFKGRIVDQALKAGRFSVQLSIRSSEPQRVEFDLAPVR